MLLSPVFLPLQRTELLLRACPTIKPAASLHPACVTRYDSGRYCFDNYKDHMKRMILGILTAGGISMQSPAIASDWGCEVLLCLANPNGPTAVGECKPPIRKLWKHLAKGKPFPICTFINASGSASSSEGNHAAHSWSSQAHCPPGYIVETGNGVYQCALSGAVTVTINHQKTKKVWWGRHGYSLDSDASMVEENYAPGSDKSDLELEYEAYLAKKAEQESKWWGGS